MKRAVFMGMLVVAALAAPVAVASTIQYTYTRQVGGVTGTFSFNDANTTTVSTPPGFVAGGSWYSAISFVDGVVAIASPVIGIYDNFQNQDCIEIAGAAGSVSAPFVNLCGPSNLWSGTALTVADNLQL
jgi:hypothetical protein